jgi:hypothetical protein
LLPAAVVHQWMVRLDKRRPGNVGHLHLDPPQIRQFLLSADDLSVALFDQDPICARRAGSADRM